VSTTGRLVLPRPPLVLVNESVALCTPSASAPAAAASIPATVVVCWPGARLPEVFESVTQPAFFVTCQFRSSPPVFRSV
jgi:hypothetical protein